MFECGLWVEGQICPTSRLARGLGFRLTAFELGGVDIDANDSRGASSLGPLGYLQAVDQGNTFMRVVSDTDPLNSTQSLASSPGSEACDLRSCIPVHVSSSHHS